MPRRTETLAEPPSPGSRPYARRSPSRLKRPSATPSHAKMRTMCTRFFSECTFQASSGARASAVRFAEPVQKHTVRICRITVWKCATTASVETMAASSTPAA